VSEARQQQLIQEQQQRSAQYARELQNQEGIARERANQLQQQRRLAQYRYQQRYLQRLRQQQRLAAERARYYNYSQDPYFYSAPSYRYYRSGRYYDTNQYGADLLRQGVNSGYEEGFYAGQADRQDGWRYGYRDSYAYQDANFGYLGFYVPQNDYNHYFREGFQRGYEDGYYGRNQYGRSYNGTFEILANVLAQILAFSSLR
jgi:hypothetical protein